MRKKSGGAKRIVVIVGHPDPRGGHFASALTEAYSTGAREAGHQLTVITVAKLDFPLLRTKTDFNEGPVPPVLREAQTAIGQADHLVILYPLWLGSMPALLKGFLEQVLRPGFAFETTRGGLPRKLLKGKSARLVVTMGRPAWFYRAFYRSHSVKSLERSILNGCGVHPVRASLIGNIEAPEPSARAKWIERMNALGRQGI